MWYLIRRDDGLISAHIVRTFSWRVANNEGIPCFAKEFEIVWPPTRLGYSLSFFDALQSIISLIMYHALFFFRTQPCDVCRVSIGFHIGPTHLWNDHSCLVCNCILSPS